MHVQAASSKTISTPSLVVAIPAPQACASRSIAPFPGTVQVCSRETPRGASSRAAPAICGRPARMARRSRRNWAIRRRRSPRCGKQACWPAERSAGRLAERLQGSGVTVNAVHPGLVLTELFRDYPRLMVKLMSPFMKTPEQGAACSLHVATAPELDGVSGEYFENSRTRPSARAARDEAAQDRLWTLTEALTARRGA